MRPSTLLTTLLASTPLVSAYYKGFNVGANNPDGSCKTQAQWTTAFKQIATFPGDFKEVRLFASSDCNTLVNAVPAAIAAKVRILAGVWTEDDAHYAAEKAALQAAIKAHGSDWLIAVSVGSEDLYRGDTDAATLAKKINDIRSMLKSLKVTKLVGHTDTWTAWVNGANAAVIKATDFVCNDAYPYWQGVDVNSGYNTLEAAMTDVKNVVAQVKPQTVWLCESGWPVSGHTEGSSVSSKANAQTYWKKAACPIFKEANTFWYSYQDFNSEPSFGVIGSNGKAIYDLKC